MIKNCKEFINNVENECKINLRYFYHSTRYDEGVFTSILTDGIKCKHLLGEPWDGASFNGKYYISLSKITNPNNLCSMCYIGYNPSFIVDGIEPIKCENNSDYLQYIATKDPRRIGSFDDEYQYLEYIKNSYIKGIVYNLHNGLIEEDNKIDIMYAKKLIELIKLLEKLQIELPIYDYSRRNVDQAHEIDKEKTKYYSKKFIDSYNK